MDKNKTIETLPDSDSFWNSIDNDNCKQFYAVCVMEKLRNTNPSNDIERACLISELKVLVEMIDSPKGLYRQIKINRLKEEERATLEDLID